MKKLYLSLALLLVLVGCNGQEDKTESIEGKEDTEVVHVVEGEEDKIEEVEDLEQYVTTSVYNRFKEEEVGAVAPEIRFINEKYLVIVNYNGALIYTHDGKLNSGIDIQGLDFQQIIGDDLLLVSGNEEYLLLEDSIDKFIYEFDTKTLKRLEENKGIQEIEEEFLNWESAEESMKLNPELDYSGVQTKDLKAFIGVDYEELTNSEITILDKDNNILNQFKLNE